MIYWIPMNKSQSNVYSIALWCNGIRFVDAIFKCTLSLKLWCLRFESWMTFVLRGTIVYKSTLVWKMACHRFSDKPLSKRVLTSPLPLKMPCVWRRPFFPCQKFNKNATTNISHNIGLFQTQNMKQYWQKRSGKGRIMIFIRSRKGVTWSWLEHN